MHSYTITIFPRDAGRAIRRFSVESELSSCQFVVLAKQILAGLTGIVAGPILIERTDGSSGPGHPGYQYLIQ